MAEIDDLEIVDASNTARFPENQAPSTLNDGGRALEGIIARWNKDLDGSVLTTGTSTAYVYAANQTLTVYADGLTLGVDFHVACGASPTINVDALGAQSLVYPDGTALAAGDISTGQKGIIKYDGTNFQFVSVSSPQVSRSSVQDQDFVYAADTGAANAYVITLSPAVTAYAAGQRFSFKATNANTTISTLNVNALGVKTIKKNGGANDLEANDIVASQIVDVEYDGTNFQMVSEKGNQPYDVNNAPLASQGSSAVLLATYSPAAVASVDLVSVITTTYRRYIVYFRLLPVVDGDNLWLRTSTDNGSTFNTGASDYDVAADYMTTFGARTAFSGNNNAEIELTAALGVGNAAGEGCAGWVLIEDPTDAASRTMVDFSVRASSILGGLHHVAGGAWRDLAEDNDAVQLRFSTGNIASGEVQIYGLKIS